MVFRRRLWLCSTTGGSSNRWWKSRRLWLRPTTGATGGCTGRVRDVCIGSPLALTARAFLGDGSGTGWPEGRLAGLAGGAGSPGCGWLGRPPASLRVRRRGGAGRGDEGWGGVGEICRWTFFCLRFVNSCVVHAPLAFVPPAYLLF